MFLREFADAFLVLGIAIGSELRRLIRGYLIDRCSGPSINRRLELLERFKSMWTMTHGLILIPP